MKCIATFPAGTYELITRHLKGFSKEQFKILENDESSVTFSSSLPVERLIELRYFTNVYMLIDSLAHVPKTRLKGKYFRLMRLKNGTPTRLDPEVRDKLERDLKRLDLKPNTHQARNEFYVIERRSGNALLALRLPRAKFKREPLAAGELRPELAHILGLTAGLKAKYKLVDMFAGYGAIPYEAVRGFGCRHVIAIDRQKLARRHEPKNIVWHKADARKLDFIADNSIDRIITDPPWGIYKAKTDELPALYDAFAKEAQRILKPGGIAVVLSGYKKAEQSFRRAQLTILGTWPILVSGKKASIYKLQK